MHRSGEGQMLGDVKLNERLIGEAIIDKIRKKRLIIGGGGELSSVLWKLNGDHQVVRHAKVFVDCLRYILDLLVFVKGGNAQIGFERFAVRELEAWTCSGQVAVLQTEEFVELQLGIHFPAHPFVELVIVSEMTKSSVVDGGKIRARQFVTAQNEQHVFEVFRFHLRAHTRFEHVQGNVVGFLVIEREVGTACQSNGICLHATTFDVDQLCMGDGSR